MREKTGETGEIGIRKAPKVAGERATPPLGGGFLPSAFSRENSRV